MMTLTPLAIVLVVLGLIAWLYEAFILNIGRGVQVRNATTTTGRR